MSDRNALVSEIAEKIEQYLTERPEAADTVEGILRWWLSSLFGVDTTTVLAALLELEARGIVVRTEREGLATVFASSLRGRGLAN